MNITYGPAAPASRLYPANLPGFIPCGTAALGVADSIDPYNEAYKLGVNFVVYALTH